MKKLKPILVLSLMFIVGMVAGITLTRVVTQRVVHRAITHPEFVRERIEADLTHKLKLDDTQRTKVHGILIDAQKQIQDLRGEFQPRFLAILTNGQDRVSAELTGSQREKFDKIRDAHRHFFQP